MNDFTWQHSRPARHSTVTQKPVRQKPAVQKPVKPTPEAILEVMRKLNGAEVTLRSLAIHFQFRESFINILMADLLTKKLVRQLYNRKETTFVLL